MRVAKVYNFLLLLCMALFFCAAETFAEQTKIVAGEYVTVKDGHLSYNGKRLKLWGTNFCYTIKRQGHDLGLEFDRLQFLGINGIRTNYTEHIIQADFNNQKTSVTVPETVKGSGSQIDRMDHAIYLAKQRGMFFWTEFNQYYNFKPGDYDLLKGSDAGSRQEWETLIKAPGSSIDFLCYVDPRAEELVKIYAKNFLNHFNPYTGKRYAEEEAIGLYQLFNECGVIGELLARKIDGPVGDCIQKRWNQWLLKRYGSDDKLSQAWGLKLNGESLKNGTVKYGPHPNATKTELAGYQTEYKNSGAPVSEQFRKRQEDIMRFTYDMYDGFNERFITYIRSLAPKGVGVNVVPITPTGRYGTDLASYYGASKGDFVSVGSYGFAVRPWVVPQNDPYYPYTVRVNEHPSMETPNDATAVAGKPYLIYETNDYRPNPYMTEFVLRAAINAMLTDADGVFWFNSDSDSYIPNLRSDEEYRVADLPMPDTGYPNAGIIMATDQMELATIQSAGCMFRNSNLPPFTNCKEVIIGKDILLDINKYNNESFWKALPNIAWSEGLKLRYDLTRDSSLPQDLTSKAKNNVLTSNNWVTFDWNNKRGSITVNADNAKAFAGFTSKSINIGDLEIKDSNRDFGYVGLIAEDGAKLADSQRALLTLSAYSTKEGLKMVPDPKDKNWSDALAKSIKDKGGKPLHQHLAATVSAPWMDGRWYRKYDFGRRCYEEGVIQKNLTVTAQEPFFSAVIFKENPNKINSFLYVGNSITNHPPNDSLGWKNYCGMAASGQEKDFVHQSYNMICDKLGIRPALYIQGITNESKMAGWENLTSGADFIVIELGDNYRGKVSYEELQLNYERIIAHVKGNREPIVVCLSPWGNPGLEPFIKKAAENQGAIYVYIAAIANNRDNRAYKNFTHEGVGWHPGDAGMKAIAGAILNAVKPVLEKKKIIK